MIRGTTARILAVALALGALVTAAGCGKQAGSGKPKVAVSIFPLWDVARRVAGDRLDVVLVLPPGKSEHGYDPTPKEIAKLDGVKLGLCVGLDMDLWADQILKSAGAATIVHLGDKVATIPVTQEHVGDEEAHKGDTEKDNDPEVGAPDPHYWLDPSRMIGVTDQIAAQLTALDPAGKDVYAANAEAVKKSLTALDASIAARAKAWTKRTIVTFHGSMSYYAKRYGLTVAAVIEPLAGKEPTPAYIGQVLAAIKATSATALFSEPQFDRAPAETIAHEAGIPLGELDPVGGTSGRESYEALLTWNTDHLEQLLK
jgi:zinc transport system substrate-binding protein